MAILNYKRQQQKYKQTKQQQTLNWKCPQQKNLKQPVFIKKNL